MERTRWISFPRRTGPETLAMLAEAAKVIDGHGANGRLLAKNLGQSVSRGKILVVCPLGYLAGQQPPFFVGQELVANIFHGRRAGGGFGSGRSARKQFVLLFEPET